MYLIIHILNNHSVVTFGDGGVGGIGGGVVALCGVGDGVFDCGDVVFLFFGFLNANRYLLELPLWPVCC